MASATMLPGALPGGTSPVRAPSPGASVRRPPLPAFSMRVAGSPGIALLTDTMSAEADCPALPDWAPGSWAHATLPKAAAKDDQFSDRDTFIYTDRVAEIARQGHEIRWASVGWKPAKAGEHELPDYAASMPVASQGTAWLAAALAALAQYPLLLDAVLFPALSAGALKLHLFDPNSSPESFQPVEVMINDHVPCQMGPGRDAIENFRAAVTAMSSLRTLQGTGVHRAAPPLHGRAAGEGADAEAVPRRAASLLREARHGAGDAGAPPSGPAYAVEVLAAAGLKKQDKWGKSDPYCELYVNGEMKGETEVKSDTQDPIWKNGSFQVQGVAGEEITIKVWDDDRTTSWTKKSDSNRESQGWCTVKLPPPGASLDEWLPLRGSEKEIGTGEPPKLQVRVTSTTPAPPKTSAGASTAGTTPAAGAKTSGAAPAADAKASGAAPAADAGKAGAIVADAKTSGAAPAAGAGQAGTPPPHSIEAPGAAPADTGRAGATPAAGVGATPAAPVVGAAGQKVGGERAKGRAEVKITAAKGLKKQDKWGKSDPYCELYVRGEMRGETEVKADTQDPTWKNGSFQFEGVAGEEVTIKVWDDDRTTSWTKKSDSNRESQGWCTVRLPPPGAPLDEWLPLRGSEKEIGTGEPPKLQVCVELKPEAPLEPPGPPKAAAGASSSSTSPAAGAKTTAAAPAADANRAGAPHAAPASQAGATVAAAKAQKGMAEVKILAASCLKKRDKWGMSDPYCELFVRGEMRGETEVKSETQDPKWKNGSFTFEGAVGEEFTIRVWDDDRATSWTKKSDSNRESLGTCTLRIPEPGGVRSGWATLEGTAEEVGTGEPSPKLQVSVEMKVEAPPKTAPAASATGATPAASSSKAGAAPAAGAGPTGAAPSGVAGKGGGSPTASAKPAGAKTGAAPTGRADTDGQPVCATVKVLAAKALKGRDKFNRSDPYCELIVKGRCEGETEVLKEVLDPQWKKGIFHVQGRSGDEIEFRVWDDDRTDPSASKESGRESLGACRLRLPAPGGVREEWLPLAGSPDEVGAGEPRLQVRVEAMAAVEPEQKPAASAGKTGVQANTRLRAEVRVLAARALKDRDKYSKSDPYCELLVKGKWVGDTEVQAGVLDPKWRKGTFQVQGVLGDELRFRVWDDDREDASAPKEASRESLGTCTLMLPAPGAPLEAWLPLTGKPEEIGTGEPQLQVRLDVMLEAEAAKLEAEAKARADAEARAKAEAAKAEAAKAEAAKAEAARAEAAKAEAAKAEAAKAEAAPKPQAGAAARPAGGEVPDPIFLRSANPQWAPLVEKGLAKMLGGYGMLRGLQPCFAWAALTGELRHSICFPWRLKAPKQAGDLGDWGRGKFFNIAGRPTSYSFRPRDAYNSLSPPDLWKLLRGCKVRGQLVAATLVPQGAGPRADGSWCQEGHPHAVLAVEERRGTRFVCLQSPWGSGAQAPSENRDKILRLMDRSVLPAVDLKALVCLTWEEFLQDAVNFVYSEACFAEASDGSWSHHASSRSMQAWQQTGSLLRHPVHEGSVQLAATLLRSSEKLSKTSPAPLSEEMINDVLARTSQGLVQTFGPDPQHAFAQLCRSGRGAIDRLRLKAIVHKYNKASKLQDGQLEAIWRSCDRDLDGVLTEDEFCRVFDFDFEPLMAYTY